MPSRDKDPYKDFCVHPFVKMYVSTQGQMRACCYSQQPITSDLSINHNTTENIWNGDTFQNIRQSFNDRIIPHDICRICIESESKGMPSQRQYENKKWQKYTEYFYHNPQIEVPAPVSYDIRISNECNLQCVMCRPHLSNQIAKNMLKYNKTNQNNVYTHEWDVETYATNESSFNQKFIDHIINNADRTQEIWAIGGEPFVMKGFQTLIEQLVQIKKSNHIILHIISNGTVIKESWLEKVLTHFNKVKIGISLDATEKILEYVRYPSKWAILEEKIIRMKKISEKHRNIEINLEPTIQLLNLKDLPNLFKFINNHNIDVSPTFLDSPVPLHFAYAPLEYRKKIVSLTKTSVDELIKKELMEDSNWLDWIDTEPQRTLSKHHKKYFIDMIEYFDNTRNIKFSFLYPEFVFLLS